MSTVHSVRGDSWEVMAAPGHVGPMPSSSRIKCHDKTRFIDVLCPTCLTTLHLHEGTFAPCPDDGTVNIRCESCGAHYIRLAGPLREDIRRAWL